MWVTIAASIASLAVLEQERSIFDRYRTCVLEAAETLVPSGEQASTIEAAARSRCRATFAPVGAVFAINGAIAAAAQVGKDVNSSHFGHDPVAHMADLNRDLSEDVANLIVTKRMKLPSNAPNQ